MKHALWFKEFNESVVVAVEQDEDGMYVATCVALPGVVAQGRSGREAVAAARDAIDGYLFSLRRHGETTPGVGT